MAIDYYPLGSYALLDPCLRLLWGMGLKVRGLQNAF